MTARRLLVTTALVLFAAAPAAASAAARPPVTPGSTYLALGDSVTFGFREATTVPPPNYKDQASFVGYPEMVGPQLKLRVTNAACSGETSGSFINVNAISNGCTNKLGKQPSYRSRYPLHVRYKSRQQSQLAFALQFLRTHRNVRLVSLMIGANDLFVCQVTTPDHCLNPSELNAVLAKVKKNVHTIVSQIRNKAHYQGQFVIEQYYSLDYSSAFITNVSKALNNAQNSGAKPFGVQTTNSFSLFQQAAQHSGGNSCTAGLLTQTPAPSSCGVHPSFAGASLLAQAVTRTVRLASSGSGRG